MTLLGTLRERAGVITRRIQRDSRARTIRDILAAFGEAGGSLLAAGLAFNALFAIIPATLALIGIIGFVVGDTVRAEEIVASLVERLPAISELVETLLDNLLRERSALSIIGVIGFIWGASGFYGSLDTAMRRLFPGGVARGAVEQRIRGVIAVLALVGAALASVLATGLLSVLERLLPVAGEVAGPRVLSVAVTLPVFAFVVWLAYVIVPTAGPGPRLALLPALATGGVIAILTSLFGVLAPLLVGQLAGIGLLAAVFTALIWMRLVFELLIYGGAWARVRRDHARRKTEAPTLSSS